MSHILASKPSAVIFDLDGTLLDTEPLYTDAIQKVLDPHGHTYSMELKKRCMGGDSRRSAQLTIEEYDLPHTVDEFLEERESHLSSLFPHAAEIAGAGDFVTALAQHAVPIGLATSSHQHLCDMKLQHKTWHRYFHTIICGDNAAVIQGKPAPDIFNACAAAISVDNSRCIAFEDSPTGIKAALAAGMTVIAVTSPYVDDADLAVADHVINDYHELLTVISAW